MRYDLQFTFKRMDTVKAEKGYAGPVVVCAVYFKPVARLYPVGATIKYIAKLRDMEIWLAPIAGTRVLVPFRVQGPTPIGEAVLQATQFVSVATADPRLRQRRSKIPLTVQAALTLRRMADPRRPLTFGRRNRSALNDRAATRSCSHASASCQMSP